MAAVDTSAYDIPALDFFHLPFESDHPHDAALNEFSCVTGHGEGRVFDYSTSIQTPPPTAYPSDDETFSLGQIGGGECTEGSLSPGSLASSSPFHVASSIWATPPTSPPASSMMHSAPPSRFQFPSFRQPLFSDPDVDAYAYSSGDDESFGGPHPCELAAPPVRRRKLSNKSSGSSAGKVSSPRKATTKWAKAELSAAAARLGSSSVSNKKQRAPGMPSPEPASACNSDAEGDDDDDDDGGEEEEEEDEDDDSQSGDEPESKRKTHNVLERKRRNDLKRSYQNLRVHLPNLSGQSRAPTGHILIKAAEYIEELKDESTRVHLALDHLRRENGRAHARLRAARTSAGL